MTIGNQALGLGTRPQTQPAQPAARSQVRPNPLGNYLAGTPLGLAAVKYWTRTKFKGTQTLKRHVNPTRIPIETKESYRWLENLRQSIELLGTPERYVHVADRESDIYELFWLAQDLGTRFLVRVQTNRLAEPSQDTPQQDGAHRAFAQLDAAPWVGEHRVVIGGDTDDTACLQVKSATIKTLPPVGKRKHYSPQLITYIHALETDPPAGRSPIDWKLVTNLPVTDLAGVIEKLNWYALRWKVEVFHKVVKSGCRAEDSRLQTAERLVKFLALITVVSWAHLLRHHVGPRQTGCSARHRPYNRRNQGARLHGRSPFETAAQVAGRSPSTCFRSPCSAAISPAIMIRRPATWSSGEA